jgi:site-specific recombinase XerD
MQAIAPELSFLIKRVLRVFAHLQSSLKVPIIKFLVSLLRYQMRNNTTNTYKSKQLLKLTIERINGAYAESTIRAYRSNFLKFIEYCNSVKKPALPAEPATISTYIESLADQKWRSASIRQTVASIATIHTLNNYQNPTLDSEVKLALKRMHRKIGRFSKQANAITREILEVMLSATDHSLRGYRDRALLLVGYDTMCRRSELVNIGVRNIGQQNRNPTTAAIFIEQSKTDQEGHGRWLAISKPASSALNDWLEMSKIEEGHLFRGINRHDRLMKGLTAGQICRIYKRLAKKAGFSKEFIENVSGHSMRVGAAQDLLLSGASLPIMMAKGRWSKPDTVMRYVEKIGIAT